MSDKNGAVTFDAISEFTKRQICFVTQLPNFLSQGEVVHMMSVNAYEAYSKKVRLRRVGSPSGPDVTLPSVVRPTDISGRDATAPRH